MFRNILVLQILGTLLSRGFNGTAVFVLGGLKITLSFKQGLLNHIRYPDLSISGQAALEKIIWYTEGELILKSEGRVAIKATLDYVTALFSILNKIENIPSKDILFLEKTATFTTNDSGYPFDWAKFPNHHKNVESIQRLIRNGKTLEKLYQSLGKNGLRTFFIMCGLGQLNCHYEPVLHPIFEKLQITTEKEITGLLGKQVAKTLHDQLIQKVSPLYNQAHEYDHLYGDYLYSIWYHHLRESAQQIGIPVLAKQACEKAWQILTPKEQDILTYYN